MKYDNEKICGYRSLVEHQAMYKEYAYKVLLYEAGHRCGYVQLPVEHPAIQLALDSIYSEKSFRDYDYEALDIDVHGGLTFMAEGFPDVGVWIGFDCNHAWDLKDTEKANLVWPDRNPAFDNFMRSCYDNQSFRSTNYVISECRGIIDQLIEKFGGEIKRNKNKRCQWFPTGKEKEKEEEEE